jgi:hypothetical protein
VRRLRRDRAAVAFGILFALILADSSAYLAVVVVVASAIVDIVVAWRDPRIRRARPST